MRKRAKNRSKKRQKLHRKLRPNQWRR